MNDLAKIERMQAALEHLRSEVSGRRTNRAKRSSMARMTYFDLCRAGVGSEDPRAVRYDEAVRSQWRYGEMVRSQLEVTLPNLLTDMWEDLHDQFELNYALLDLFRVSNHSDLGSGFSQLHSDMQTLFSALQSLESCVCSALNTLIDEVGNLVPVPPGPEPEVLFVELVPASANAQPGSTAVTFTATVGGSSGSFVLTWCLDDIDVSHSGMSYTTPSDLSLGSHTVSVTVVDDVTSESANALSALMVTSEPAPPPPPPPPPEGAYIEFEQLSSLSGAVTIEVYSGTSAQGGLVYAGETSPGSIVDTEPHLFFNQQNFVRIQIISSIDRRFTDISFWPSGQWTSVDGGVGASYWEGIVNIMNSDYVRLVYG
jgi:hypothetical protein